jgi:hypothetical protein
MKSDGLLPEDTTLRSSKHLNNLIEQDHRHIIQGQRDARLQALQACERYNLRH